MGTDISYLAEKRVGDHWEPAFDTYLESGDPDKVRREVLTKMNAAKGGGYIIQSDHSVPYTVDPATYDYFVQLVHEHGTYPLDLGEFDEEV